jgi:hypothetical protein
MDEYISTITPADVKRVITQANALLKPTHQMSFDPDCMDAVWIDLEERGHVELKGHETLSGNPEVIGL